MERLIEALPLLAAPFAACLAITALHAYVGLHIIKRGVIFVDLALAQCAALGAAIALFLTPFIYAHHHEHDEPHGPAITTEASLADSLLDESEEETNSPAAVSDDPLHPHDHHDAHEGGHAEFRYGMSLLFALLGAVLLSFGRLRDERIPHEAIIGIIFVVCAALSVLILSKAPHGHERMEAMLVGSILFVGWSDVFVMVVLYLALGIIHVALRKPFIEISKDLAAAERAGRRIRLWDCLFYGSFAVLVTNSVSVAGVFVVFSYLIIPPACAALFCDRFGAQLVMAWVVGALTTVIGLGVSAVGDMPTGPSLVASFGAILVLGALSRRVWWGRRKGVT